MRSVELLSREFLEMRCRLIDLAAAWDRIERGADAGAVGGDERMAKLREAAGILVDGRGNRAERMQMVFSDAHDPDWRRSLGL